MKKIFNAAFVLSISAFSISAQFSESFNSYQDRSEVSAVCWQFSNTDLKTSERYAINSGTDKPMIQTGQLSSGVHTLTTPFIGFSGSGVLTFKHKLSANNGSVRDLRVYVKDANDNQVGSDLYTWDYPANEGPMTSRIRTFTIVRSASAAYNLTGNYRIVFEYTGSGGSSRGVLDNIAFTSGTITSDPANNCLPAASCTDSDNDNVCDDQDEFPNDATRAYRSANTTNTYAFEDLWPAIGDFDFNDAVIWCKSNYVLNGANEVVGMEWESVTRAVGAGLKNGFALSFPSLSANSVTAVSGSVLNGNYASIGANGTESGISDAVVFIYESADDVINRTGGPFYNTVPGASIGVSDTVKISITFTAMATSPVFDPFLIVDQDRGREIHRAGWAPTSKANLTYFGRSQDDSNPGSSRYYVTKNNYPWVITIPGTATYDYPTEKTDIVAGHLKFAAWAQSSGANFTDWYENLGSYRDVAKIY